MRTALAAPDPYQAIADAVRRYLERRRVWVRIFWSCADCDAEIETTSSALPPGWRIIPGDHGEIIDDETGECLAAWADDDRIVCPNHPEIP